jgi:hypothetical protein
MRKRFILALCHYDSPGVIQAFGPYDTEEAAKAAETDLYDVVNYSGMAGRFEITPCYDLVLEAP